MSARGVGAQLSQVFVGGIAEGAAGHGPERVVTSPRRLPGIGLHGTGALTRYACVRPQPRERDTCGRCSSMEEWLQSSRLEAHLYNTDTKRAKTRELWTVRYVGGRGGLLRRSAYAPEINKG